MVRLLEALSSLALLIVLLTLGRRAQHTGSLQIPGLGHLPATLVFVGIGIVLLSVAVILWHRIRTGARSLWTTLLLLLPLLLLLTTVVRQIGGATLSRIRSDDGAHDYFYRERTLAERDAHAFVLRLLASSLSARVDGRTEVRPTPVVGTWFVPEGFQFHIAPLTTTTAHLFSRRNGLICRATLSEDWRLMGSQYGFTCVESEYAPRGPWSEIELIQSIPLLSKAETHTVSPWPQYRRVGTKTGSVGSSGAYATAPFWYTTIQGQARATPSLVSDVVLIGTHGNGVLEARDRRTGLLLWRQREPNWIHQDAVSDGRTVYVGFGDNNRSFKGAAPSGVAAHDLETGERRWVRFADNSVMTSPVLWQHLVVFGDASGAVQAVNTMDGTVACLGAPASRQPHHGPPGGWRRYRLHPSRPQRALCTRRENGIQALVHQAPTQRGAGGSCGSHLDRHSSHGQRDNTRGGFGGTSVRIPSQGSASAVVVVDDGNKPRSSPPSCVFHLESERTTHLVAET